MSSPKRLTELSAFLHEQVTKIDDYIALSDIPSPSFQATCPPTLKLPQDVDAARQAALEALDELRDHLLGPVGAVTEMALYMSNLVSLQALTRFDLASKIPQDGQISIEELAKLCKLDSDDLAMLVRHGVSRRIFKQNGEMVSHTAISSAFKKVPKLRGLIATITNNSYSAPFVLDAMEKWPGSQEPDETAYNLGHSTTLTYWEHLQAHPQKAKDFATAMEFSHNNPGMSVEFVLAYDWMLHSHGTVVDIGGSQGVVATTLAAKFPDMKVVVQDREEVIALAPQNTPGNIEFQVHDFFEPQPIHDADVYFLRWVLHDWSDQYCRAILQALIPALKPKARVIIMDAIVPEVGVLSPYQERRIRNYDIIMKGLFNSRERTEGDWRKLIASADSMGRFKVVDLVRPVGSLLGVIVVEWAG